MVGFQRVIPCGLLQRYYLTPRDRFNIMRARYEDTLPFLEMAKELCKPLEQDHEGLAGQDETVKEEFEEQLSLFHLNPGAFGLHTNQEDMSLPHFKAFTTMVQAKLGDTPPGNDQRMAVAWNELGNAYLQNKEKEQAEKCFVRSINALDVLDNPDANALSMPKINLGFVFWLQGRLDEAAAIFQESLDQREKAYGKDDQVSFA